MRGVTIVVENLIMHEKSFCFLYTWLPNVINGLVNRMFITKSKN